MRNKKLSKISAFTLMEIMIVFIIIGIFALFATHSFEKYIEKQKELNARTDLQLIYAAAKMYKAKHNENCPTTFVVEEINQHLGLSLNENDWNLTLNNGENPAWPRAMAARRIDGGSLKVISVYTTGTFACTPADNNPCYY